MSPCGNEGRVTAAALEEESLVGFAERFGLKGLDEILLLPKEPFFKWFDDDVSSLDFVAPLGLCFLPVLSRLDLLWDFFPDRAFLPLAICK